MGKLFVVPTPVGNLKDMTYRAVEVLKQVDHVLTEDTRVTGRLLAHYSIEKRMVAYHNFNEHKNTPRFIEMLKTSEIEIALVSDAGMPGISDPGFLLFRKCREEGISVECLPGATSVLPALVQSGLPMDRFTFEGFLPHKRGRRKQIRELEEENRTMVFFESPHRITRLLGELCTAWGGERPASLSRELTKLYEETQNGTLEEIKMNLEKNPKKIKGEFVLIVAGKGRV